MEKREFFDHLHKELSIKHGILEIQVRTIRSLFLGHKISRLQIAEWAAYSTQRPRKCADHARAVRKGTATNLLKERPQPRKYYQDLLNFVASCSNETWEDINQKTQFDLG